MIDNHYTYSTDEDYEKILNQSESYGHEEFVDLTRMLKQHYISISPHTMPQKLTL